MLVIHALLLSKAWMAQQGLALPALVADRTSLHWFLPSLSAEWPCSRLDAICMLSAGRRNGNQNDIQA